MKQILTNPNVYGVIVRYIIAIVAAKFALAPENVAFLNEHVTAAVGAVIAIGVMIYGVMREPSQNAADIAKKIDKGDAIVEDVAETPVTIVIPEK